MSSRLLRLIAILATLTLVLAACGNGDDTATDEPPADGDPADEPTDDEPVDDEPADVDASDVRVGLVYDIGGRGDLSFNDSAAAGLDRAISDFGVDSQELEPDEGGENREELLRLLSEQNFNLVFGVGFLFADSIAAAAADFPDVNYGLIDGFVEDLDESSNIVALAFAEHEGSFLVGAAAALKSENNHIGFIGGVQIDLIEKFEAGFVAGAREVNPDIEIEISYISQPPDFSGFADPARGREVALGQFDAGADVVYHAAGGSGAGLFEAAMEVSQQGEKVWAIGVDSDQYQTAPAELQEYILTSMLKRVDVAVYETISDYVDTGEFTGGYRAFGLEDEGVGYSTSGGFIDDIVDQLEELKQRIIDGDITVPEAP